MGFVLQIDYYAEGKRVLTLSPNLVILVTKDNPGPVDATVLIDICPKCREHLRTWPAPMGFTYLSCACLCLAHSPDFYKEDIIDRWREFRRLQNRVLAWSVHN
jgi:hypothetical protein